MKSMGNTTGLDPGAGVVVLCRLPVTLSTHSSHKPPHLPARAPRLRKRIGLPGVLSDIRFQQVRVNWSAPLSTEVKPVTMTDSRRRIQTEPRRIQTEPRRIHARPRSLRKRAYSDRAAGPAVERHRQWSGCVTERLHQGGPRLRHAKLGHWPAPGSANTDSYDSCHPTSLQSPGKDRRKAGDVLLRPGQFFVVAKRALPGTPRTNPREPSMCGAADKPVVVPRTQRHWSAEDVGQIRLGFSHHGLNRGIRGSIWQPKPEASVLACLEHKALIIAIFPTSTDVHLASNGDIPKHRINETQDRIAFRPFLHAGDSRVAATGRPRPIRLFLSSYVQRISSSVNPTRCAASMIASRGNTSSAYRRFPAARSGSGSRPRAS